MKSLVCPNCGADLVEDAWENLSETEDGGYVVDAYLAYVCKNHCGYVERIEEFPKVIAQQGDDRLLLLYPNMQGRILEVRDSLIWPPMHVDSILGRGYWDEYTGNHDIEMLLKNARDTRDPLPVTPNLFKFATSELSQDAFLCWLFDHVRVKSDDIAYKVAKHFLDDILDEFIALNSNFVFDNFSGYSVKKIEQQVHNIDILLTLESSIRTEKIYIIIEDKIHSGESRENQPEYYARKLKINDSESVIIPVLFKTGFATKEEQENFKDRNIIFIGNKEIYDVFSTYSQRLQDNVILNSWWIHFNESYYMPIEKAKALSIDPDMTLENYNLLVKENKFPEIIVFKKITDFLFHPITGDFLKNLYSVQGHGHVDWHFEISKANWKSAEKNISLSVYFIWDTYNFSFVIKTSPYKYKKLKNLTDDEKKEYMAARDSIKSEIRINKQINWKITNYYLQIAQMKHIQNITLDSLKKKVKSEIGQISNEIDRIIGTTPVVEN